MNVARGAGLQPHQIQRALELRELLEYHKLDVYAWTAELGYTLTFKRLRHNAFSVLIKTLFGSEIRVRPKLNHMETVASIAHEICHDLYHADCIAYRMRDRMMISIEEGQAEMFASLVLFPSLKDFETVDVFFRTCGVSSTLAEMRIAFFEKYGW